MPRHIDGSTRVLRSVSGTFGEIQVVASRSGVLVDVQGRHYGSDARLRTDHGLALMPLETARRLRDILSEVIAAAAEAAPSAPGIWSNATVADIARRFA